MLAGFLTILFLIAGVRIAGRRLFRRKKVVIDIERCQCGYTLENLATARCPECGRVFGFNATAEELGLTDEELHRMQAARLRRRSGRDVSINL